MPTVLSDLQKARLQSSRMAFEAKITLGPVVSPRFFCCTAGNETGVVKEPVAIINISPVTLCVNDSITYDGTASYDPDGAVTTYAWTFGDAGTSAAASGAHQYTAVGVYTVTLTVTDGTGLQGSAYGQVTVIDCTVPPWFEIYAGHKAAGPYYFSTAGAWSSKATGLTGNWLNIRCMRMNPFKKYGALGSREVWVATQAGVAYSIDDMATWTQLTMDNPRNTEGAFPAPQVSQLDWYTIAFNPMYENEVYILAGTATRAWVYWTEDGRTTWDNWQVTI